MPICETRGATMQWMNISVKITLIYLAAINMVTFFMYGIDKWKLSRCKIRKIMQEKQEECEIMRLFLPANRCQIIFPVDFAIEGALDLVGLTV